MMISILYYKKRKMLFIVRKLFDFLLLLNLISRNYFPSAVTEFTRYFYETRCASQFLFFIFIFMFSKTACLLMRSLFVSYTNFCLVNNFKFFFSFFILFVAICLFC